MRPFPRSVLISLALAPLLARVEQSRGDAGPPRVSGVVFVDRNANGIRDAGEPGVPGAAVSDQEHVVVTDATGDLSGLRPPRRTAACPRAARIRA